MTYAVSTISDAWQRLPGQVRRFFDIDITSYTASGESLTASDFVPFNSIVQVIPLGLSDNGHVWRWDGSKIRAYKADTSEGSATLTPTDGNVAVTENWGNALGGETDSQLTSAALGVGDEAVHSLTAITTSAVTTAFTNPDYARNVYVQIESAGGGALPATMGNCTIDGTDLLTGATIQEVVDLSPVASVVLGAGEGVRIKTTKVFATVTQYQFDTDIAATLADVRASIGLGTKLALSKQVDTGTEADDILRVLKNDTVVAAATYVLDATNHAVEMGADLADNDEVTITYLTDADVSGGTIATAGTAKIDSEASSTDDVGSCRCEVIGIA